MDLSYFFANGVDLYALEIGRRKMKRYSLLVILAGLVLWFGGAANSQAHVKRVQMHIAGYLCGN
jgi:hypothetical protein